MSGSDVLVVKVRHTVWAKGGGDEKFKICGLAR